MMVHLQLSSSDSGFPAGCEHLDANRLLEGYTDRGAYAEWTAGIDKSPNDTRDYRLIKLQNGLECMLVHDPTAQSCAASMAVRVGHLQDPEELPGLAHFLEHLLFMGSSKFPGENDYSDHLSKFDGHSNAYTSTHQTVYYFEVTHAGFVDALDRFAQFFICPLFNESCVEREIKAVDSEHQKNLQNDGWRLLQLRRSLAKSDHPYHKFGTGSLDTLWTKPKADGLDIRAELIKFYEQHYSANLMKLSIVASDPLDVTLQRTLEFFSGVPNKNTLPTVFQPDPYPSSLNMSRIAVKQIQDTSFMIIQMPFYDSLKTLGSKPATLLSYLISNEGPHSLYAFLKKKSLVTYLRASPYNPAPGIHFYNILAGLTEEGLRQHRKVASIAFEYVRLLKSQPFPNWVFKELKQIFNMHFRFLEADPSVSEDAVDFSTALHNPWPRSQVFSAPYTLTDDDPEKIKEALAYLTKEKAQIFVATNKDIDGLKYDQREKWYGTEYAVESLKSDWFEGSLEKEDKLSLPGENHFIPSNFELIGPRDVAKPFPRPLLVKQTDGQRIWFKQDDRWKIPKGRFSIKLSNPFLRKTYKNGVLAGSYIFLVDDALTKYASDAAAGGLGYELYHTNQDLVIQVFGYTEKLPKLFKHILYELKNVKVTEEAFNLMKESKLKALNNETHDSPVKQCVQELNWILNAAGSTFDQRKEVLNAMKPADVEAFAKELLSNFYAEAICHGNFTKTTLYDLVNMAEEVLDYTRLPRDAIKRSCSRIIPEKSNYMVRLSASSKEEVNNAIRYYTNVGHPNDQEALVRLYLLRALIAEPCFNVLRTQQQLGYIVGTGIASGSSHCGLYVTVQSARSPVYVETRINAFLEGFAETLSSMDLDKFESVKNGLIANLLEPYKTQESESDAYWDQINNGLYDFFRQDRIVAMLKPLSLKDIHAFFMKHVHPASETRAKVSIHLYSHRVHSTSIDKLVEVLEEHKIDPEPIKTAVHDQPLPKALREIVEKHIKETSPELHHCCKDEILGEVDKLDNFPDFEKDLPGTKLISSIALKNSLKIGEPRKPIGDFYDGVARL